MNGAPNKFRPSFDKIYEIVYNHLLVDRDEIRGRSRKQKVAEGRHAFMWLCKNVCHYQLFEIANELSMDHSTVMNNCISFENRISQDYLGIKQKAFAMKFELMQNESISIIYKKNNEEFNNRH